MVVKISTKNGDHYAHEQANNGLPVCAMRERVNRYTVSYWNMLTLSAMYGKISLQRKDCCSTT